MGLTASILALLFAIWILIDILKKDPGTPEMQKIAKFITEGSEGFFMTQYYTIFKLSFIFCIIIMIIYYTRTPPTALLAVAEVQSENIVQSGISNIAMSIFSGITFLFGAFCSAFSGYSGMWVSVRANVRY